MEPGDVVIPAQDGNSQAIIKSTSSYQKMIIGVVSTAPGVLMNSDAKPDGTHPNLYPLALAGRVPMKVSTQNGPINIGDYLTSSSIPGVAMKATKPGETIGKALESFDCSIAPLLNGSDQNNTTICSGKILVFVNVGFADPQGALANLLDASGNVAGASSSPFPIPSLTLDSAAQALQASLQNLGLAMQNGVLQVKNIIADTITGNIINGQTVNTQKLCVGQTCVTEQQLKILLQQQHSSGEIAPPPASPSTPAQT